MLNGEEGDITYRETVEGLRDTDTIYSYVRSGQCSSDQSSESEESKEWAFAARQLDFS